jgi:outer membrane protein assembly factor BamE (lipoprotein component of BamABCDE complex)
MRHLARRLMIGLWALLWASGCTSAADHRAAVQDDSVGRLTVGSVQREIRVGMSGAEVVRVMGSPNIVTTDESRREVWVYDKVSTETVYSTSSGGVSALVLGGALIGSAVTGGVVSPYHKSASGAVSTSQRTLTVIVKFDEAMQVRDFAYHASRF